jgi:hypothetical protein
MIRFLRRLFRRHVNHLSVEGESDTLCGRRAADGPPNPRHPYCGVCVVEGVQLSNINADRRWDMSRRLDAILNIVNPQKPFDRELLESMLEWFDQMEDRPVESLTELAAAFGVER